MKYWLLVLLCTFLSFQMPTTSWAAYVTMARFDINGDGEDEIVRTEGIAGTTSIKIYHLINDSFFYKPIKEFKVPGNLVQVPDISDLTGDQIPDFYFATGSDIGVIFYDTVEEVYKRENEIDEQVQAPVLMQPGNFQERLALEDKESNLYLDLEQKGSGHEPKGSQLSHELKGSRP